MAKKPDDSNSGGFSRGIHALASIGRRTGETAQGLFGGPNKEELFAVTSEDELFQLADALRQGWDDEKASKVLAALGDRLKQGKSVVIRNVCRWALAHPNDPDAVIDCLDVEPPDKVDILRLLSRAGSQKLVYLATWRLAQRQVVLKRFVGSGSSADLLFERESVAHPLRTNHPNIIDTYLERNSKGQPFLLERYMPDVLSDGWRSNGVLEAANLLSDIAKAIKYLQEAGDLVHGDIKPDNIAESDGKYVLLDFGICRPAQAFSGEYTPTGSLRTRPPELLLGDRVSIDPHKIDVWALGATVFNSILGRFPLYGKDESPPRISKPEDRANFEHVLSERVRSKYDEFVNVDKIPDPLRDVLRGMLCRDADQRLTASETVEKSGAELSAFLRDVSASSRFSPVEEIDQLSEYLPTSDLLDLIPGNERRALIDRLEELGNSGGLEERSVSKLQELKKRIGGPVA